MFRDLLGGLKKEAEKLLTEQEARKREEQNRNASQKQSQPQQRNRRSGKYGRLAAWIKSNYGDNFRDGQTSDEVKNQLDRIFRDLDSTGALSGDAKMGFKTFIDTRKYGDLVKVRE